jgi:hypothetical protein
METELDTELVLLDPAHGEMFSLNATGRVVWRALGTPPSSVTLDALVAAVVAAFDIDPQTATTDVVTLLRRLQEAKLISERRDVDPP